MWKLSKTPPAAAPAAEPEETATFSQEVIDGEVAYTFPVRSSGTTGLFSSSSSSKSRYSDVSNDGQPLLYDIVRQYTVNLKRRGVVPVVQLYKALGHLRATQQTLRDYNASLAVDDESDGMKCYAQHRLLGLYEGAGWTLPEENAAAQVPGLDRLVESLEHYYAKAIAKHRAAIASGSVEFDGLGELYRPGTLVSAATSLAAGTLKAGYRVRSWWYDEQKVGFKTHKRFCLRLECAVNLGQHYALVTFDDSMTAWTGVQAKTVSDLRFTVEAGEKNWLQERGARYSGLLSRSAHPLFAYQDGAFFPHGNHATTIRCATGAVKEVAYVETGWWPTKIGSSRSKAVVTGSEYEQQVQSAAAVPTATGRIVIDNQTGFMLNHFPAQQTDKLMSALVTAFNDYKDRDFSDPTAPHLVTGTRLLIRQIPAQLHAVVWPVAVGFSFTSKMWGHVVVDALSDVQFNDAQAFEQLVLAPERKQLVQAVGRQDDAVLLLHGPPGVGKLATVQAIAEMLHRPLYHATLGELGTTPQQLSDGLGSVLELCAKWGAVVVVDEAGTLLDNHGADLNRYAMACVMLRMLDLHPGLAVLTVNHHVEINPALQGRVSLVLQYDPLSDDAKEQVWRNALAGVQVADLDVYTLAAMSTDGRQIKRAVQLAHTLSQCAGVAVAQKGLEQILATQAKL